MVEKRVAVNAKQNVRVGFVLLPGHWLGGINYFRNLFAALHSLPEQTITPVIFTGERQSNVSSDFPDIEVVASSIIDPKSPAWYARKLVAKISAQDFILRKLLQTNNVSVLSHSFPLGRQNTIGTIGWIPDFQHIHLPEFFTAEERAHRDREFLAICSQCDKIVISSACANDDLQRFAPEHAHKAELLRFVATPIPLDDAVPLFELQKLYSFEGNYFLLPNQFWAHKNHRVVINALQKLKQQNRNFLVLATGSANDSRNPSFFASLMQYAAECEVLERFRVLGQIPFNHLAGLMQHATSLINPSLFEGWSTSVEEAKSMGKQIILSDLPVHREQAPERGIFFPPQDSDAFAEAMITAHTGFDVHQDTVLQSQARAKFPQRQRKFALTYQALGHRVKDSAGSTG
jgi:glycosyltransferase involved in cell wall biosynthesis